MARVLLHPDIVKSTRVDTQSSLEGVLAGLVERANALFALMVSNQGDLLGMAGRNLGIDPHAVAALAAATHAATAELAQRIGEEQFEVILHQGKDRHVHTSTVDESHVVVVVFEGIHNVGRTRFATSAAQQDLLEAARRDQQAAHREMQGFRERAGQLLDKAFSGYLKE